jgi:energy-coupling factor transport system ATP-binding protein
VSQTIIKFENVSFSYYREKKPALDRIDLSVMEGEFLAVAGENGAGKTTLLRLINGIIPHCTAGRLSGNVTVDGTLTRESSVPQLALKVGMVLDDPDAQIFTSSVLNEAAFGPENILLPPQEVSERARWALSAVGLAGFENRRPSTLSGGEKQRLAIAASLAMKGKILVLDEPLCRLDPQGEEEVMSVLRDIRSRYGITIVMAAHESNRIAAFADRVCVLKNGGIAAVDSASNIFANHSLLEENGIQPPFDADIFSLFSAKESRVTGNENENPAVSIKNICYSYGQSGAAIENINLSIADNEFLALIGRNGCGKTTLLKIITGLLRPHSGDIFIRGKNTKEISVSDISKEAGFVMQNPESQLFTDSVYNEVSFALKNAKLKKEEIRRRVNEALDTAGLKDADAFPPALSRADRTKTVIACVIAMGCKIIILDEVDSGTDYRGSRHIMDIARDLHKKGFTIIFVTHNMSLAAQYAHRLVMMERNGITFDGRRDY